MDVDIAFERTQAVAETIAEIRTIETEMGISRETLDRIAERVRSLAARAEFWGADFFTAPGEFERQNRYLISEDEDKRFALYLNVLKAGKKSPPHNHTTWACVAGVEGEEHNYLYDRVDGGIGVGPAELKQMDHIVCKAGTSVTLLPDDIHHIEVADGYTRQLHMYGHALETLTERLAFNLEKGTAHAMDIGVETKR
jgi:predicted metal-dependent enzyme (double-stranded beta helix superfamily)